MDSCFGLENDNGKERDVSFGPCVHDGMKQGVSVETRDTKSCIIHISGQDIVGQMRFVD